MFWRFKTKEKNFWDSANFKRVQDRSIVSSIKPEFDGRFFVDFTCCVRVMNKKLFLFWFAELKEQFQVHNLYKTRWSKKICGQTLVQIEGWNWIVLYSFSCKNIDFQPLKYVLTFKQLICNFLETCYWSVGFVIHCAAEETESLFSLSLQNKRTCNSTVDNLLILLGQQQQKNERSSREKRAHLRAMMLPDQRLYKKFESGGGATVCWIGVLCKHFLVIKMQHWNKCLSSLL